MEDEVGGVDLGLPSRGNVVTVSAAFAVVDAADVALAMFTRSIHVRWPYTIIVASSTILAVLLGVCWSGFGAGNQVFGSGEE